MMEDEQDSGYKFNDEILESGTAKSAEDMHVFPLTTATTVLLTNWGSPVYFNSNFV
jgi:hypothetical protein